MKTLIVYYSRSGVTRTVAEALGQSLKADVEEIRPTGDYRGIAGWMRAGKDATFGRSVDIEPSAVNPADYDMVVIGSPVWAFTMASPVRTWLAAYGGATRRAAFFCTMGGSGDKRTFAHMEKLCGKKPSATMTLIDKDVRKGKLAPMDYFVTSLLQAAAT